MHGFAQRALTSLMYKRPLCGQGAFLLFLPYKSALRRQPDPFAGTQNAQAISRQIVEINKILQRH